MVLKIRIIKYEQVFATREVVQECISDAPQDGLPSKLKAPADPATSDRLSPLFLI